MQLFHELQLKAVTKKQSKKDQEELQAMRNRFALGCQQQQS